MALLWSAGIIWFAVEVAGSDDSSSQTAQIDNTTAQAINAFDSIKSK